jgi:hypothetical protein
MNLLHACKNYELRFHINEWKGGILLTSYLLQTPNYCREAKIDLGDPLPSKAIEPDTRV